MSALERLASGLADAAQTEQLVASVLAEHRAYARVSLDVVTASAARVVDCEKALGRLRTVVSPASLIQRACDELAAACGFTRVLLSRVEDGAWRPWRVNQLVHGEDWFSAWEDSVIPLDDLVLERVLLTEHRPDVVLDTTDAHPFFRAGASPSYALAPIATGGRAVGFFHVDHGFDGRPCDDVDRDVLWAFTEGFAHLYERTVLLERLRDQRTRVRRTLSLVDEALQQLTDEPLALAAGATADEEVVDPQAWDGVATLTPREREVLAVLATGASNAEIAERLVLSVGTVKTHVKHVLSKLGVLNRAQAVTRYLEADPPPTGENHPPAGEGQGAF